MIGAAELRKMKETAFLINAARGPIVDESALIKALQEGWIRGAGLDVFEQEPISMDNPLLTMENVILSPHALAQTDQTVTKMWKIITEQIDQLVHGEIPKALVNPEVLEKPLFKQKFQRFRESLR